MLRPNGLVFETDKATGNTREIETFCCKHCNRHTILWERQRPEDVGGYCSVCGGLICKNCVGKGCDPLEKKLERWASRERLYQNIKEL
jgi:hypothetical protein